MSLYPIMVLQEFSARYGLPSEFSVECESSANQVMAVRICGNGITIGDATVKYSISSLTPAIEVNIRNKVDNPISPSIVPSALLWGYERGYSFFKSSFSVKAIASPQRDSVVVSANSLEQASDYVVDLYKKRNGVLIGGDLGR